LFLPALLTIKLVCPSRSLSPFRTPFTTAKWVLTVEVSASANVPSTEVCMSCHSQVRVGAPQLANVQKSWDTNTSIEWNKVHDIADFVYFNHSAHINKGMGCSECHGQMNRMEAVWKNEPMTMGWCLECHRNPASRVRPREEVFNMEYRHPENQAELGAMLVTEYNINTEKLPQCSTCHR
jgi:Cytochrome c7 and related cytochrome c